MVHTTTTTSTYAPPPPAPYDPYYDSYNFPYSAPISGYGSSPSADGGLYYYYPAEETTTVAAETTTEARGLLDDFNTPLMRIFVILILASIGLPNSVTLTSVKRKRRGEYLLISLLILKGNSRS